MKEGDYVKSYKHSKYSYVTIVEIPKDEIQLIDMDLCAQPKQTLNQYYKACSVKPAIICNGGFFALSTGETCFNYTDDGKVISVHQGTENGMGIVNGKLIYGTTGKLPFTDFVSAFPTLIENGKRSNITMAQEINYKARRTILAYNETIIYVIAIESPGMNFYEMQNMLMEMNLDYAINLDGGGSTKILENGKSITSTLYNRAVDNVIAFYLKPKVIYRVQAGAFSYKKNAENFLKQIHELGGYYTDAYIRKIGRYYKVQMGAFSVKANAIRMLNDLKSKGFDAFITTV